MPRSNANSRKARVAQARRKKHQKREEMDDNWAGRGMFKRKPKESIVVQSPRPVKKKRHKSDMERALDKQLREIHAKAASLGIRDTLGEVVAYHTSPRYQRFWIRDARKEKDECITDSPIVLRKRQRVRAYSG